MTRQTKMQQDLLYNNSVVVVGGGDYRMCLQKNQITRNTKLICVHKT
jgi:hypothetical protein